MFLSLLTFYTNLLWVSLFVALNFTIHHLKKGRKLSMPIKIVEGLPIRKELKREQIVTMDESTARTQDIRPLKILILNLMPKKETTELQLLRLLGNTPLQIEVDLMYTATYEVSNTPI